MIQYIYQGVAVDHDTEYIAGGSCRPGYIVNSREF
jgi:hypothetical protein